LDITVCKRLYLKNICCILLIEINTNTNGSRNKK
jgi:hypothetical protein